MRDFILFMILMVLIGISVDISDIKTKVSRAVEVGALKGGNK